MRQHVVIACIVYILLVSSVAFSQKRIHPEKWYQSKFCDSINGISEYRLPDSQGKSATRVDCLTSSLAVEIDFSNKGPECVGQALYYASKTNLIPVCLLILERGDLDYPYARRLIESLKYTRLQEKQVLVLFTNEVNVSFQDIVFFTNKVLDELMD